MFNVAATPFKLFLASLLVAVSIGCTHRGVSEDHSMPPILAQDTTLVVEGCGHPPIVGYTYCRKYEGDDAKGNLIFHLPPVKCQKSDCIYVKILSPVGRPAVGFSLSEGKTRLEVSWKSLLGRDVFETGDRGFWIVIAEIHYLSESGLLKKTIIEGEIRLRVLSSKYSSLENIESDPNFVWLWRDNNRKFKMTSNGRIYLYGR